MNENNNENLTGNEDVKREHKKGLIIGITCGVVACLVAIYFCVGLYYTKHLFDNVYINGTDVSKMTAQEIMDDLKNKSENYTLLVSERNGQQEYINGTDFDLQFLYNDELEEIFEKQHIWEWGIHLFKTTEYNLETIAEYDSEKLNNLIAKLECMDDSNMESPTDAYLDYDEENGLILVSENKGSKIDRDNMLLAINSAVGEALTDINLDIAGVYVNPKITGTDESLTARYNLLKQYLDMVITYHFDDNEEVLDRTTFYDWMSETSDGKVDFDQDEIKAYVKGLASRHNTAYRKHELETSYGQTITISTGSYGWIIDQESEREELYEALMAGESQDREPVYSQTAASHTGNDYGDTYVEVNLSAQHLFFYVDGELLIETDFVSGNASKGWTTPGGIYPLTYKERNATLRGTNYATPVSYWMPFNGNIGLHDSTWRSTYGKNIYKTNGSHGCINLPPSAAEVIFDNIEKGMPVICYYLDGTGYEPDALGIGTETESESESEVAQEQEPTLAVENTETTDDGIPAIAEVTTDTVVQQ